MSPFANLDQDLGPLPNSGSRGFEKVIEELQLLLAARRLVVVMPLLAAVNLEPFLAGGDALVGFERAAGVQALVGPAGHDVCGNLDRLQRALLAGPVGIVQRMCAHVRGRVLGARRRILQVGATANDERGLRYAAVIGEFTVPVGESLPGVDRRKVRRSQRSHLPLNGRQVRDP